MKEIVDYNEYKKLFSDDLIKTLRKMFNKFEDYKYSENGFEDSKEYNEIKSFFNKFGLWKKLSEEEFNKIK